jgi:hypothetical protein
MNDVDLYEALDLLAMRGWVELYDFDPDDGADYAAAAADDFDLICRVAAVQRLHPEARTPWDLVEAWEVEAQAAYDAQLPRAVCQCGVEYVVDEDGAWSRGSLMFYAPSGKVLRDRDSRDRCSCGRPIGEVVNPQLSLM